MTAALAAVRADARASPSASTRVKNQTRTTNAHNAQQRQEFVTRIEALTAEIATAEQSIAARPKVTVVLKGDDLSAETEGAQLAALFDWLDAPRSVTIIPAQVPAGTVEALRATSMKSKRGRDPSLHTQVCADLTNLVEAGSHVFEADNGEETMTLGGSTLAQLSTGTDICLKFYAFLRTVPENAILFWDEPENSLHATRRHQLLEMMYADTRRFVLASHATEFADVLNPRCEVYQLTPTYDAAKDQTSLSIACATTRRDGFRIAQALGLTPCRVLFQANVVVWVEGPSDVIIWQHWIRLGAPHLVHGFDYTLMMYGGVNLDHTTLADEHAGIPDVDLLSISRHPFVIVDTDVDSPAKISDGFKPRVKEMMKAVDALNKARANAAGIGWPSGRELENCYPTVALRGALVTLTGVAGDVTRVTAIDTVELGAYTSFEDDIDEQLRKANWPTYTGKNDKAPHARGRSFWAQKPALAQAIVAETPQSTGLLRCGADTLLARLIDFIQANRR